MIMKNKKQANCGPVFLSIKVRRLNKRSLMEAYFESQVKRSQIQWRAGETSGRLQPVSGHLISPARCRHCGSRSPHSRPH